MNLFINPAISYNRFRHIGYGSWKPKSFLAPKRAKYYDSVYLYEYRAIECFLIQQKLTYMH